MSRALNLKLSESAVVKHCRDRQIGLSVLEALTLNAVARFWMIDSESADS